MEIFGVGPVELLVILIVILVIFGPEQLPEIVRKIGSATREVQRDFDNISREMNENLEAVKQLGDAAMTIPPTPATDAGKPETPALPPPALPDFVPTSDGKTVSAETNTSADAAESQLDHPSEA